MAVHELKYPINSTVANSPGTAAAAGETKLLGTSDAPAIVEIDLEAIGDTAPSTSKIPRRSASGHLSVPTSGQANTEVMSKQQIDNAIASGVYRKFAHSFVADHTAATVGDTIPTGDQTTDPALAVNDLVVNTTDTKIYKVTSVAGGTTGNLVVYDAGELPVDHHLRVDKSSDKEWVFDSDGLVWVNLGGSDHARQHSMSNVADHTATADQVFYGDSAGNVAELALSSADKPLISGGVSAAPLFSALGHAPDLPVSAQAVPVAGDFATWQNNTMGIIEGSTGKFFVGFKNSLGNGFAAELGSV